MGPDAVLAQIGSRPFGFGLRTGTEGFPLRLHAEIVGARHPHHRGCTSIHLPEAGSQPIRAKKGMVISASEIASKVGAMVLRNGGNAIDAAVATAFALAVTHPTAGNIGGGGFLVFRPVAGNAVAYDFREMAPTGSSPTMFLKDGTYDSNGTPLASLVGSGAWHSGGPPPRLAGPREAPVEASG